MATSLTLVESDIQEEFFARGWTDGLPIVPPTPERINAMSVSYTHLTLPTKA